MVLVTTAEPKDLAALAALLEEMDRFYGATELGPAEQRRDQIHAALFGALPAAQALLAWDVDQLIGFATYSFLWPAEGMTRSLYLKELYVTQTHRQRGVGKLLMQSLCEVAVKHGCSRVEWTTDQDNSEAQRFYERLGATIFPSKVFYRLEGDKLRQA